MKSENFFADLETQQEEIERIRVGIERLIGKSPRLPEYEDKL